MGKCCGITKSGAQCTRTVNTGTLCYQHKLLKVQKPSFKQSRKPVLRKADRKSKILLQKILAQKPPTIKQEMQTLRAAKKWSRKLESPSLIAQVRRSRDNPFASKYLKSRRDSPDLDNLFNRLQLRR